VTELPKPAEAKLVATEHGLIPESEGWFILNAADARWRRSEAFGEWCEFEGDGPARFPEVGVNFHLLHPGKASCMYHAESNPEDFLVVSGECLVVIEGQARRLRAWDLVHCPAGAEHVFVGGEQPCLLLMIGARKEGSTVVYPVSQVAARHGGSVEVETSNGREAYAGIAPPYEIPPRRDALPGAQR
jgi:uncharacterized cupin superfamily protein